MRTIERVDRKSKVAAWASAIVAACALCVGGPASARPKPWLEAPAWLEMQVETAPMQRERGAEISLQQAIEMARRQYPGRVVRADTTTRNGRVVHEIRILGDDSRVRDVRIDAQSTPRAERR